MQTYEFDALVKKHENLDAVFVEFPYDVEREFGMRGQVKVAATFDGFEYRGSLVRMGHACHLIGLTREVRTAIGKGSGDSVHVTIRKDDEPRVVEIPDDLRDRLAANVEARRFFEGLSYSHRREYVQWITEAKKAETRERRLAAAVEMLRSGKRQR